jgi:excinuclease UvrABC ATPase subunit
MEWSLSKTKMILTNKYYTTDRKEKRMKDIFIKGLIQNNLKNVTLTIPKDKIIEFTGVSGSGKPSIVFDTIAAESQRLMNETYPTLIRGIPLLLLNTV